jgi:aminopeptidase N
MSFLKSSAFFLLFSVLAFSQNSRNEKNENLSKVNSLLKINYPGDSTIDVKYYKLNLKVTYNPNYLSGSVAIKAAPSHNSLNSFFLDLQDPMEVDSILSNNQKVQFTHANAKLNITLNKTYNQNEEFEVTIYYQGVPGSTGFGSFVFGTHGNNEPIIWTLSEPYGASDWFPVKDTPADKADSSDVWMTVPDNLYAVSNGDLVGIIKNGDGTSTYKWTNKYPIAQYLISMAISDYTIYENYFKYSEKDSMPVINYIFPENLAGYKTNLDKVPNMLRILSNYFGLYPFIKEKYGNAEMGWKGGGGMEHQTVSSMSNFSETVILHELAHQWFGDKITCRDWQDIWLNEGFATFCEMLYAQTVYGDSAYKDFVLMEMSRAKNAQGSIYVQDISSISQIFNGNRSYSKGGIVLHMLRGIVGDSVFLKIMKAYSDDPLVAYGTAVTADFQRDAEAVSGQDLEYFFNEWIYGSGYPKYKINWSSASKNNNEYEVTVNINQTVNTYPSFFTMPVQLEIATNEGDTLLSFFNNQQDQQVKFLVKGDPTLLTLDPNNWILKDAITFADNNSGSLNPVIFKLDQNHPNPLNPFNPTTTIEYQIPELNTVYNIPVKLAVYDILGNEVAVLVNKREDPGKHSVIFNAADLASGVYFYRLTAGSLVITKKLLLLK